MTWLNRRVPRNRDDLYRAIRYRDFHAGLPLQVGDQDLRPYR
jgi:hypothetical protein